MPNSTDQTFQTERKKTDKSLGDERDKTNRSLNEVKGRTESRTDANVQQERAEIDNATLKDRARADLQFETDRKSLGNTRVDHANSARTLNERKRSDDAMDKERARVDVAIVHEREVKSVVETRILSDERNRTDKNLAAERTVTDTVIRSWTTKLSTEVAEHSKTKVSLTTRDEFLAIVSHDLRNPIGAVSSCMGMLLEESKERGLSSETRGWLEFAKRNADSSLRLIGDILEMERIAGGKLELSTATFDVGKLIREAIESFVHAAIAKNVFLRSVPAVIAGDIVCDRDRISQVLSNLIGNALKFTPEGGKIILEAARTEFALTISVCDTGPGIPDEKRQQIFDKFAQIGSKDRRGLGLGLYISKMLVKAHGGSLWVESKLGQGSTFYFSIPTQLPAKNAH